MSGARFVAGDYRLTWVTHSPEATVTVIRDEQVVANVEGSLVERIETTNRKATVNREDSHGARTIIETRLGDGRRAFVFDR